jgi:hypothetical protein
VTVVSQHSARAIAAALPEVTESSHFEVVDFRVRNKIFATLPDPAHMVVRIDPTEQAALLAEDDQTWSAEGYWGRMGWTKVRLATVDEAQLREIVLDAWRRVAPKRVVAAFEGTD